MLHLLPTKHGTGVTVWGSYIDLNLLYQTRNNLKTSDYTRDIEGSIERIIDVFGYEIRHAFQGDRLTKTVDLQDNQETKYYGFNFSWIDLFFSISCMRHNAAYSELNKLDLAMFFILEYEVEKAMDLYDLQGSKMNLPFINGVFVRHEKLWQYYNEILYMYLSEKPSKKRFRNLRNYFFGMQNFAPITNIIERNINRAMVDLNCSIWDIDYQEYENVIW